jgi:hypothetical protein
MSMDWDGFETSTVPEEVKNNSGKVKLKRQETKVTRHKTAIAEVLRQCQHESKDDAYAFGTSNHEKTLSAPAREHFIAKYFFRIFEIRGAAKAPDRADPVSRLVDSFVFEAASNILIILNCVYMWVSADWDIMNVSSPEAQPPDQLEQIELAFTVAYTVEFLMKLARFRLYYFYDSSWKYNWLELTLLVLSYVFLAAESGNNLGWLRMLRVLKLAKAFRIIRLMGAMKSLKAMLSSLLNTLSTLFWSAFMMFVCLFFFSLIIVIRVTSYLKGEEVDPEVEDELLANFGGIWRAILTLGNVSTGGDGWLGYYDLLEPTGWVNQTILLMCVAFLMIALLNVILGIFVDQAMSVWSSNKEDAVFQYVDEQQEIASNIRALCQEFEDEVSDSFTQDVWDAAIKKGSIQAFLNLVGLSVHNTLDIFDALLLSGEDGVVYIDEFVQGCMRMKGTASACDMMVVLHEVQAIRKLLESSKQ